LEDALTTEPVQVEVSGRAELLPLGEDVEMSGTPRVLCRDGEALAIVTPARSPSRHARRGTARSVDSRADGLEQLLRQAGRGRTRRQKPTQADIEAFVAAAGSWSDIDIDAFLADMRSSRGLTRPPLDL
jgi:hypothetical protein